MKKSNWQEINIQFGPDFTFRWGHGKPRNEFIGRLLDQSLEGQARVFEQMLRFVDVIEAIPLDDPGDGRPYWGQNFFPPLDGFALYSLISLFSPKSYVEIGSGNSTKFARYAINNEKLTSTITSIDPAPRAEIDLLSDNIYRTGMESIDLELFDTLQEGDVVFLDGSHLVFTNSDATVFFLDVIPRLKKGIIVGIHDIFLPNDYPPAWQERHYNEQYLLAAYLLGLKQPEVIVFACNYMAKSHADLVQTGFSASFVHRLRSLKKGLTGGAFWFRIS